MKKITSIVFSFLLVFTLFVGAPITQVMASTGDSGSEIQRKSKEVTYHLSRDGIPPQHYFYNYGGYAGYLLLQSYYYDGKRYHATYKGMVFDSPPYPAPTIFIFED